MVSKTARPLPPGKLAAPKLSKGALERKRLFDWLDAATSTHQIVWIEGQPGAGKTTLVSGWVAARRNPALSIWYQVDAGDADPATFFHYLGLAVQHAAPRVRRPMPHLTLEYLGNIELFASRFFEELARRLKPEAVIVFDNFQDAGESTLLHTLLASAIPHLTDRIKVLFVSRHSPPPAFVRLQLNGQIARLNQDSINLTLDEARDLAKQRGLPEEKDIASIHQQTSGWAAGLVLLLEKQRPGKSIAPARLVQQDLFDYFSTEVLERLDDAMRTLLLQSALLPKMQVADMEMLTGLFGGGRVLADLARKNFFTYRLALDEPVFEFHPLFRSFLLARARKEYAADQLKELQVKAARLMESAGQIESAADLWCAAGAWPELARLINIHAGNFIAQGRSQTVIDWLGQFPAEVLREDGWVNYWSGLCRLVFQPTMARDDLTRAYAHFESSGDIAGQYLALAGILESYAFDTNDLRPVDHWVSVLESLIVQHPDFPNVEIEARILCSAFNVLLWRQPTHSLLTAWEARAKSIVLSDAPVALRVQVGISLIQYHIWKGDYAKSGVLLDALRIPMLTVDSDPFTKINWYIQAAMQSGMIAEHDQSLTYIEAGTLLAETSGMHALDSYLLTQAVFIEVSFDRAGMAEKHLSQLSKIVAHNAASRVAHHHLYALVAWLNGDMPLSAEHGRNAIELAVQAGGVLPEVINRVEYAITLLAMGDYAEACGQLERARALGCDEFFPDFMGQVAESHWAFISGDELHAVELLRTTFESGEKKQYVNFTRWHAPTMSLLCAKALEYGIEPDYARMLIKVRKLPPPEGRLLPETWPWHIKLRTLGRFALLVDDKPFNLEGRAQNKTIDLLKSLIALGGRDVPDQKICEALWPEAEGDLAHQNFKVTLHRLRKLIGADALVVQDGKLSLDARHAWVDAWAFERRLGALESATTESNIARQIGDVIKLYGGAFLQADDAPWVLTMRERLRGKFLRIIGKATEQLCSQTRCADVLACYQKGIEIDPLAESFYQGQMHCHHCLKHPAAGLAVYRRCREVLERELGVAPSNKTEVLHAQLRQMSN